MCQPSAIHIIRFPYVCSVGVDAFILIVQAHSDVSLSGPTVTHLLEYCAGMRPAAPSRQGLGTAELRDLLEDTEEDTPGPTSSQQDGAGSGDLLGAQGQAVAVVVDSEATGMLMMGALSPGAQRQCG